MSRDAARGQRVGEAEPKLFGFTNSPALALYRAINQIDYLARRPPTCGDEHHARLHLKAQDDALQEARDLIRTIHPRADEDSPLASNAYANAPDLFALMFAEIDRAVAVLHPASPPHQIVEVRERMLALRNRVVDAGHAKPDPKDHR